MLAFKNLPELLRLSNSVDELCSLKHEHVYEKVLDEIEKIGIYKQSKNTNQHLDENLEIILPGFIHNARKFRLKYNLNMGKNKFKMDNDYIVIMGRLSAIISTINSKIKQMS